MKELAAEKADDSRLTVAGSFLLSRKAAVLPERKALWICDMGLCKDRSMGAV